MNPHELAARVSASFGMMERPTWSEDIPRAVADIATERAIPQGRLMDALGSEPWALRELAGRLTVGETFFLRHPDQFVYFAQLLRAWEVMASPHDVLRVWSAGCASGEEPYSIAIVAAEVLGRAKAARVRIVATDLCTKAIEKARRARYTAWSFRGAPAWLLARYMTQDAKQLELDPEIRDRVDFRCASLTESLESEATVGQGVIFFRNVAIYLDQRFAQATYRRLAQRLGSPGVLFLSPSDPPPEPGSLQRVGEVAGAFRVGEVATSSTRRGRGPSARIGRTAPGRGAPPPLRPALRPRPTEPRPRAAVAAPPPTVVPSPSRGPAVTTSQQVHEAANAGDLGRALAMARQLAAAEPADGDAHAMLGRLLVAVDDPRAAVAALRRAVYLAPDRTEARYWYATALRADGDVAGAVRQLRAVEEQLAAEGRVLDADEADLLSATRFFMAEFR